MEEQEEQTVTPEMAGELDSIYEELGAADEFREKFQSSPFVDEEESPFGEVPDVNAMSGENKATPLRTLTAAAAMVGENGQAVPGSQDELVAAVQQNIDLAEKIIEAGEERNLMIQSAVRQAEQRIKTLRSIPQDQLLPGGVPISQQTYQDIQQTVAADTVTAMQDSAEAAMVEEAIKKLQTYSAVGDTVAMRVLVNKLDPTKNSTFGVIQENLKKAAIIANAVERAELDETEESLVNSVVTAIISVPQTILLGDMFKKLGNVDEGKGGYEKKWWRVLFPGDDYAEQINALQSMSSEELANYMPEFLKNVKGNATTFGLTDRGTIVGILNDFRNSITEEERKRGNAFHWLDVAGLVPFTGLARGAARTTELFMGIGVRKQAADRVAAAVEETIQGGAGSTARKFGITQDEIVEHTLPSAINPGKLPHEFSFGARAKTKLKAGTSKLPQMPVTPRAQVSLSGEINDSMAVAREVTERLRANSNTYRHFTPEEVQVAVRNEIKEVEARVASNIADYDVRTVELPSGQVIYQADVIINRPFATAEEAQGFLKEMGYGADVTSAVERTVPLSRPEGTRMYHGTTQEVKESLKASSDGKIGPGVYVTPSLDWAHEYAGYQSADFYRKGANILPVKVNTSKIVGYENMDTGWTREQLDSLATEIGINGRGFQSDLNEWIERFGKDGIVPSMNGYRLFENFLGKERFAKLLEEHGYEGVAVKYFNDPEVAIFNPNNVRPDFSIVEDVSGQYFPKVTVDVGEYGFYTNPLHVPRQMYVSRWILNPSQTSDIRLFEQQTKAGQLYNRIMKKVNKDLLSHFAKLSRTDRTVLDQVLLKGSNMKKWFNENEFNSIWERATGKIPSDNVKAAYFQYKVNNDVEWILRNSDVRTQYVIRGFEEINMPSVAGDPLMGKVFTEGHLPKERIYDASEGKHFREGELTPESMKEMMDRGYVLVQTEDYVKLNGAYRIRNFLVKKSDIETNPIRQNILEYVEGGHRLYADKNFVKQARTWKNPDETAEKLDRPNVFVSAGTMQEAKIWAATMEKARHAVLQGADAKTLDETVFVGQKLKFPTGEEFIAGTKDGTYNLDHPFEAVFDRELPSAYAKTHEGAKFADEEEPGFGGLYRTTGRLYYSHKGEHLRAVDGELSPTLDAFQAQSNALYNVARLSTFSDFKTSAINRWVDTFRQHLNYRGGATPQEIFNTATVTPTLEKSLANQIEGQRSAIQRVLNFRSDFDMHVENGLRQMHEWIAGESDNALRRALSKAPLYLMDRNPVSFLRGWAFDFKLGLFNPGQLIIQISTAFSAAALSPRAALKGWGSMASHLIYRNAKRLGTHENVLDLMAKRGMHKLAGFDDVQEYKDYVRFVDDSGFLDFGDTQALINASNPASTFSIGSKIQAAREMGRFFFYQAEAANRLVAFRIAYDEAVEAYGKKNIFKNFEAEQFIRGRAENYSFNMSETSRSAWQKGLLSIPTQFWAYNIRMAEALVGKNFTKEQKIRLFLAQMGFAGTAGIPLLGWTTDYFNAQAGHAPQLDAEEASERNIAILQRGLLDAFILEMTGADVQFGKKWGTGDFFHTTVKDLMGLSEYGPKSFADVAGGATFSIWYDMASNFAAAAYWMTMESGGNDVNLARFEMEEMFRQVSTINNVYFKAWFAHNYGIYQSMKGRTLVADLPPATAPFIALGFAPGELRDREAIMAWRENKEQSIKDSADFINRLWSESIRQPDKMERNGRMVNEFINMIPEQHRTDVLKRAHLDRDPSDYDRLLRLRQTDQIVENFAKADEEENKE